MSLQTITQRHNEYKPLQEENFYFAVRQLQPQGAANKSLRETIALSEKSRDTLTAGGPTQTTQTVMNRNYKSRPGLFQEIAQPSNEKNKPNQFLNIAVTEKISDVTSISKRAIHKYGNVNIKKYYTTHITLIYKWFSLFVV